MSTMTLNEAIEEFHGSTMRLGSRKAEAWNVIYAHLTSREAKGGYVECGQVVGSATLETSLATYFVNGELPPIGTKIYLRHPAAQEAAKPVAWYLDCQDPETGIAYRSVTFNEADVTKWHKPLWDTDNGEASRA